VPESRLNDDRRTIGRDVSRADVWYPAFDPPKDESYLSGGMGLSDIGEQGCSPKKEVGTPETRLRQRFFKQFRPTYMLY